MSADRVGAAALIPVLVAAVVLGAVAPAGAAPAPAPPPGQGLSPEVAALPATSAELDAAEAKQADVASDLQRDQQDLERTTADLDGTEAERAGVTGLSARRADQVAKAEANLARVRQDLRTLTTEWYVTGFGSVQSLDPTLSADELSDLGRQQVMAETAAADSVADERFVSARLRTLRAERDDLEARRATLDDRAGTLAARRDKLTAAVQQGQVDLITAAERVAVARLNATIEGTDMSTIALDAYWRAANELRVTEPRCRMTWWALAGIGRTESTHGTYLGNELGVDGRVAEPILGPPLDGSNGFAVVKDSDQGRLDGTATTDRAVGPMQFLPSTWRSVGRDGTGDGAADPQNIYDAALSAGVYLCRASAVGTDAGLRTAYFSYNRSATYVDLVVQRANGYRDAVGLPSSA